MRVLSGVGEPSMVCIQLSLMSTLSRNNLSNEIASKGSWPWACPKVLKTSGGKAACIKSGGTLRLRDEGSGGETTSSPKRRQRHPILRLEGWIKGNGDRRQIQKEGTCNPRTTALVGSVWGLSTMRCGQSEGIEGQDCTSGIRPDSEGASLWPLCHHVTPEDLQRAPQNP